MSDSTPTNGNTATTPRPKCGIIMPISPLDGLPASHWENVKNILREALGAAGFEAELVSDTEESTIIQKTIVHNLYNNDVVVCDVSGKNPNVMFELGIRLTFDKPTLIVKDDKTDYSFDMSSVEHLGYPRSLHYPDIVLFKERLTAKVKATYEAGKDPSYSTFLKHFGQFLVPKLEEKEVSSDQFIIKRLEELATSIGRLERTQHKEKVATATVRSYTLLRSLNAKGLSTDQLNQLKDRAGSLGADILYNKGTIDLLIPASHTPVQNKRVLESVVSFLDTINSELTDSDSDSAKSQLSTADDWQP